MSTPPELSTAREACQTYHQALCPRHRPDELFASVAVVDPTIGATSGRPFKRHFRTLAQPRGPTARPPSTSFAMASVKLILGFSLARTLHDYPAGVIVEHSPSRFLCHHL